MATTTIRDVQDLPAVLTMRHVQDVLGICKPKAYELAHTAGFPVVKFGKAFVSHATGFLRGSTHKLVDRRVKMSRSEKASESAIPEAFSCYVPGFTDQAVAAACNIPQQRGDIT